MFQSLGKDPNAKGSSYYIKVNVFYRVRSEIINHGVRQSGKKAVGEIEESQTSKTLD